MTNCSLLRSFLILGIILLISTPSTQAIPREYEWPSTTIPDTARQAKPTTTTTARAGFELCLEDSMTVVDGINSNHGSDCWGWESPDGTEYAIMGVTDGIVFVNVETMTIAGKATESCGNSGNWRDMKTFGNYCYAVTECGGFGRGLWIIDMSPLPDSVRVVKRVATNNSTSWHNLAIDSARGFIYLGWQNFGFLPIDINDPENPVQYPFVTTGGCHDLMVRRDTAWVCESFQPSFSVWDMANKNNAQLITRVTIPNAGFVHQMWVSDHSWFAVTTEETPGRSIKIWDIRNLEDVRMTGQVLGSSGLAHNAFLKGDTLFLSHYESGVVVWDLTNQAVPVILDQFDTYPVSDNPDFNGAWGVYPYTRSGRVYASNIDGRLFVLNRCLPPTCCANETVGNVDCTGIIDIGDVTVMIQKMFITLGDFCCEDEADMDFSGLIDIGDLTLLIHSMFITLNPLPSCP